MWENQESPINNFLDVLSLTSSSLLYFLLKPQSYYSYFLGFFFVCFFTVSKWFLGGALVKNLPANAGDVVWIPGSGRFPRVGNGNLGILAWKILWTKELGRLQSMGSQRVGHDWLQGKKNLTESDFHSLYCVSACSVIVIKPFIIACIKCVSP